MNERIKQLAEQALFESGFDDEQNIKITMDIFTQLIVRECIDTLEKNALEVGDVRTTVGTVAKTLKAHFGDNSDE